MKVFLNIVAVSACLLLVISTRYGLVTQFLCLFLFISTLFAMRAIVSRVLKSDYFPPTITAVNFSKRLLFEQVLKTIAWLVIGYSIYLSFIPALLPDILYEVFLIFSCCGVLLLVFQSFIQINFSGWLYNICFMLFAVFLSYQIFLSYNPIKQNVWLELSSPFKEDMYVYSGGNGPLLNRHYYFREEKYAYDIATKEDGRLAFDLDKDLSDFESFGKAVYSPVGGLIVEVENYLPDLSIGEQDLENLAGNHIIIKVAQDIYVLLAHLKNGSISVAEGETIQIGQRIAEIGNSGNTSQPHLHLHAMSSQNISGEDNTGIPIYFKSGSNKSRVYKRGDTLPGF